MRDIFKRNKDLIIIICLGLGVRIETALYLGNNVDIFQGIYDQVSYHNLALRLNDGFGFTFSEMWWPVTQAGEPTAHWSYLYTIFLALIYKVLGPAPLAARFIQILIT